MKMTKMHIQILIKMINSSSTTLLRIINNKLQNKGNILLKEQIASLKNLIGMLVEVGPYMDLELVLSLMVIIGTKINLQFI